MDTGTPKPKALNPNWPADKSTEQIHGPINQTRRKGSLVAIAQYIGLDETGTKKDLIDGIKTYAKNNSLAVAEHGLLSTLMSHRASGEGTASVKTSADKDAQDGVENAKPAGPATGYVTFSFLISSLIM